MNDQNASRIIQQARTMADKFDYAKKRIEELEDKKVKELSILDQIKGARKVCQTVLTEIQTQFKVDIEDLMSLAIKSIFHRFEFELEWKKLKSRTDLNFNIRDGADTYELEGDLGGSILDVISFASRPVFHGYQPKKSRKILFFDEAFKWIGRGVFQERAGELIRRVAHEQGYQVIFITHEGNYKVIADKAFTVSNVGNQSSCTELNLKKGV